MIAFLVLLCLFFSRKLMIYYAYYATFGLNVTDACIDLV